MKKFLLSLLLSVLTVGAAFAQVTDEFGAPSGSNSYGTNKTMTGSNSRNTYFETTYYVGGKTPTGGFQLNSGKASGIALQTNTLGANIAKITITVKVKGNKTLSIYAQNEPYVPTANKATDDTHFKKGTKVATLNFNNDYTASYEFDAAYRYFSICEASASIVITNFTVEYAPAGPVDPTVTISDINAKYSRDLTLTPVVTAPEGLELTYTSSDETVVANDLKVLKPGIAEITAAWTATDQYNAGSTNFTVNIDKGTPVFAWSATAVEVAFGSEANLPSLNNPESLEVIYDSSNATVASIDDNGTVTVTGIGTATITAMAEGNDFFTEPAEAQYTITVTDPNAVSAPVISPETGDYFVGLQITVTCTTEGAEILYSFDETEWLTYTEAITLNQAGEYSIHAKAVKNGYESDVVFEMYNIKKQASELGFAKDEVSLELGKTALFIPELNNPAGREVAYTLDSEDGALVAVPGENGKYLVVATGHAMISAQIAANDTHEAAEAHMMVTVNPETVVTAGEAQFDFTSLDVFDDKTIELENDKGTSNYFALVNEKTCTQGDVVITMNKKATTTGNGIRAYQTTALDLRVYTNNSFIVSAAGAIKKIVFTTAGTKANLNKMTANAGSMTSATDQLTERTWTAGATDVNSVTFSATGTTRINTITVTYEGAGEGEGHIAPEFAFAGDILEAETYEPVTLAALSEGLEVVYVVNDEPLNNNTTFTEEGEYFIEAYTLGNAAYLPAYAATLVTVTAPAAPEYLTIHYTEDGNALQWTKSQTVQVNDGVAEFKNIVIRGFDMVGEQAYGHMFFSLWKQPEAMLLAEETWADFSAENVTFTPAEHLTAVDIDGDNSSSAAMDLVRNRKGTFTDVPNVFRMPADREYNLAVNIDNTNLANGNHTMSVTGSTQTGVESVAADAAETVWYTIEGLRVDAPAAGSVYIRVRGNQASKVYIR